VSEGSYNTSEILQKVYSALEGFFEQDKDLLETKASERSITHKLAEHLQGEFPGWDVDCEYNRKEKDPKKYKDGCTEKLALPDIIVHKRTLPENLLVIEAKKSNSRESEDNDTTKLRAFTAQNGDYSYRLGLFIVFDGEGRNIGKVKCFENDREAVLPYGVLDKMEALGHGE